MRAVRVRAHDQQQAPREAGPPRDETLQGADSQDIAALPPLQLPQHRVQLQGQVQAGSAAALHPQPRRPGALPQRGAACQRPRGQDGAAANI